MRKLAGVLGMGVMAATLAPLNPQAAQAQSNRAEPLVRCSMTVLHFTERGFAFECAGPRNENHYVFVVNPAQGYDRIEAVISAVKEHNTNPAAGRARTTDGLWVKHRNAGANAQTICAEVRPRLSNNPRCLVAVDVSFR